MDIKYEVIKFPDLDNISEFSVRFTGGDIGGTKQRLILYGMNASGLLVPVIGIDALGSTVGQTSNLISTYKEVLSKNGINAPTYAGIGVAGPVDADGSVNLTNMNLYINPRTLEGRVSLINDFGANGHAVPRLMPGDLRLIGGPDGKDLKGKILLIGPGTGLGVAVVEINEDGTYTVFSSEGGHNDYVPRNPLEMGLKLYIEKRQGGLAAACEQVGAGIGIPNIIAYLAYGEIPSGVDKDMVNLVQVARPRFIEFAQSMGVYETPLQEGDPRYNKPQVIGRKVIKAYKDGKHDKILGIAIDIMVGAVAVAARNNVHSWLAYSGVIVGGGNARRLEEDFARLFSPEFNRSNSHHDMIANTPIYVLKPEVNKYLGCTGAAYYAMQQMMKDKGYTS